MSIPWKWLFLERRIEIGEYICCREPTGSEDDRLGVLPTAATSQISWSRRDRGRISHWGNLFDNGKLLDFRPASIPYGPATFPASWTALFASRFPTHALLIKQVKIYNFSIRPFATQIAHYQKFMFTLPLMNSTIPYLCDMRTIRGTYPPKLFARPPKHPNF